MPQLSKFNNSKKNTMQNPFQIQLSVPTEERIRRIKQARLDLDTETFSREYKELQDEIHLKCCMLDHKLSHPYGTMLDAAIETLRRISRSLLCTDQEIEEAKRDLEKAEETYNHQATIIKDLKTQYLQQLQKVLDACKTC